MRAHDITNILYFKKYRLPQKQNFYCQTLLLYMEPLIVGLNFAIKISEIVGFGITRSRKVGYLLMLTK